VSASDDSALPDDSKPWGYAVASPGDTVFVGMDRDFREGEQLTLRDTLAKLSKETGVTYVVLQDGLHVERITPADADATDPAPHP